MPFAVEKDRKLRSSCCWAPGREEGDRCENSLNPPRLGIKTNKNRQLTVSGWERGSQVPTRHSRARREAKVIEGYFPLHLPALLPWNVLLPFLPRQGTLLSLAQLLPPPGSSLSFAYPGGSGHPSPHPQSITPLGPSSWPCPLCLPWGLQPTN